MKTKSELHDWLRPEYKRSDHRGFVRGKYADRARASTNVVILDPEVARTMKWLMLCCVARAYEARTILGSPNISFNSDASQSVPCRLTRRYRHRH